MLSFNNRSKTRNALNFPPDKVALAPNRHLLSRSRFLSCLRNCRLSRETRSTSGPARTATSAPCVARSAGSSTLVSSRGWWWFLWLDCKCLWWGFSSRGLGKVRIISLVWEIFSLGGRERHVSLLTPFSLCRIAWLTEFRAQVTSDEYDDNNVSIGFGNVAKTMSLVSIFSKTQPIHL